MSNPSHSDIMRKLKEIKGIKELLEKAVLLYVLLTDGDLPVWCYPKNLKLRGIQGWRTFAE